MGDKKTLLVICSECATHVRTDRDAAQVTCPFCETENDLSALKIFEKPNSSPSPEAHIPFPETMSLYGVPADLERMLRPTDPLFDTDTDPFAETDTDKDGDDDDND